MPVNGGKTRFRRPWRAHEKHPCFSMVSPPFTGIPSSLARSLNHWFFSIRYKKNRPYYSHQVKSANHAR